MAITELTKKKLFASSNNRCPICDTIIYNDVTNTLIGEICHIEAKSANGSRYNANMSDEQRDDFDNLLVLCANCHKQVDSNPKKYSVDHLKQIKRKNIVASNNSLLLEKFKELCFYKNWNELTFQFCVGESCVIDKENNKLLHELVELILSYNSNNKLFPDCKILQEGFLSLSFIFIDFLRIFHSEAIRDISYFYFTKFYKRGIDYKEQDELYKTYVNKVVLMLHLLYAATQNINLVIDRISENYTKDFLNEFPYVNFNNNGLIETGKIGGKFFAHFDKIIRSKGIPYEPDKLSIGYMENLSKIKFS